MRRRSSKKLPDPRSTQGRAYLDVACDLVRLPGGVFRVGLSFRDWVGGDQLSMHDDFAMEGQARVAVARAIALFSLRRVRGLDQWRNASSPGFSRAIWRTAGRLRRARAHPRLCKDLVPQ